MVVKGIGWLVSSPDGLPKEFKFYIFKCNKQSFQIQSVQSILAVSSVVQGTHFAM